ncbi:MAG: glycogen synthase GlgA [Clostridiales bacterium]|nr:glycogen synthase GlgA [Clostridiales bacterium]
MANNTKKEVSIQKKKSVLFIASEANPFAGTGGLADVIGSLPKALAKSRSYDVRVVIPLYKDFSSLHRDKLHFVGNFNVELSWRNQYCGLFEYKYEGVKFYFLDNEYYFKRDGLYGFYDDGERFAFFSKASLTMMRYLDFYPDIVHAHDWQSALSVIYLKTLYKNEYGYDKIKTMFTIHNIEYQGKYDRFLLGDVFGLSDDNYNALEYDNCVNLLKGAMVYSDVVSTVSPTYAEEIKYDYFSHGLSPIVNEVSYKTVGILNGIDQTVYNPETDERLFANYTSEDLSGKKICKKELQKMLGLPEKDVPIIAMITRLVGHKGVDLLKCVVDDVLSEKVQLIILGKGEKQYEDFFKKVQDEYSTKCRAVIAYNKDLSSKIYSGADIFLMPSKSEPCGLSQMIAARYGTVPVVRKTGGLADSISPYNLERKDGNGFRFETYNAHEMLYVLKDAVFTYSDKKVWNKLMVTAMKTDFSWRKSAKEYIKVYDKLI